MTGRCACGALWLNPVPEDVRLAVALVAACVHGDAVTFADLYDEANKGVVLALVEGTHALLTLFAEAHASTISTALEVYCSGGTRAADDIARP